MRLVNWYWTPVKQHYFKNVIQWYYDDEKKEHVYVSRGVMCMDNFGNLVSCNP